MPLVRVLTILTPTLMLVAMLSPVVWAADGAAAKPARSRPQLLVMTDIGGDPDDQQAMVRLMLYSNEFEIEGLVASAAGTLGELKEHVTRPEKIREIVEAYAKVRPNLVKHADGYPPAEELLAKIKSGNPQRGKDAVGEEKDTEGSRWIMAVIDRDDPRHFNIVAPRGSEGKTIHLVFEAF